MTKQKFKYWFSFLAVVAMIAIPYVAFGAGDFLCSPTEGASSSGDAFKCILNIRNAAIVVVSIAAVFMISYAGYLYMFAAGNEGNVSKAKGLILSAIAGIVILLAGGLILEQINPDLLNFRSISPEGIAAQRWFFDQAGEDDQGYVVPRPAGQAAGRSDKREATSCATSAANCVNITQATGIECKDTCTAQKAIVDKLAELKRLTPGVNWIVSEGYPPTRTHKDRCHQTGSCVDIAIRPNDPNGTSQEWLKLCSAIRQISGVGMLNEISAGFAPQCGKFIDRSAAHISFFLVAGAPAAGSQTPSNTSAGWPTGSVTGKGGAVCNGGSANRATEPTNCSAFSTEIAAAASATGLTQAEIRAIIHIESQFNAGAGNGGAMQVTQATASTYQCIGNWATNVADNIKCGAKIFSAYKRQFGSIENSIAAYNGGPGANDASRDCPELKRWQCAFDNPEQSVCNTGFLVSRNYALNYKALLPKYQTCGGGAGTTPTQPTSTTIPGVSNYTGPERWPDADWSSTKPELKTAFDSFNQKWQQLGNPPWL